MTPRTWRRVVAVYASVVLAHARRRDNLTRGMDIRSQIGVARGIQMDRYRLTAAAAFAVLRRHSQDQNVKMSMLAEELISTGHLAGMETGVRLIADDSDRSPAGRIFATH